jgi:multiple sugar transport system ATP-binding protein
MASIRLQLLSKRFGSFSALNDLNLAVRDHEFLALLGPSGCGKSTTMNLIAGMLSPSSGSIRFDDQDVTSVEMGKRGVGFVFQNYAVFTHMTVRENLAFGLRMRRAGATEIASRVHTMAERLQLVSLLDRKASGLSVNILQRLAIGRSAIVEPKIFLLDEPLSNVDAAFRAVMRTELKTLQRQFGQTMVYVTHDQLEAMTMADRIAIMNAGELQQVGAPLEVYNNPCNRFVAGFIGSPGMNLLDGRLSELAGRLVVNLGEAGRHALGGPLALAGRRAQRADVTLGVRPEDVAPGEPSRDGVAMTVTFVERIGARTIVHCEAGDLRLKLFWGRGDAPALGSRLPLKLDPTRVRLFDGATGAALRPDLE